MCKLSGLMLRRKEERRMVGWREGGSGGGMIFCVIRDAGLRSNDIQLGPDTALHDGRGLASE